MNEFREEVLVRIAETSRPDIDDPMEPTGQIESISPEVEIRQSYASSAGYEGDSSMVCNTLEMFGSLS